MKAHWDDLAEKLKELQSPLEEMLDSIPLSKRFFRMKQKIERCWKDVSRAYEKLDPFISDAIEAIPVNSPWGCDVFKNKWKFYKDYLKEQHGIQMQSRMEVARLEWLKANTNDNPATAIAWINFWIARGSDSIYKVNIDKTEEKNDEQQTKRAGFSLPTNPN